MKKYEKEVVQAQLNNEKEVLKKLEANYQDALDEINDKIAILLGRDDADMQHVIYQVEYQKALKTQVQIILETLQTNEFETVSEYLTHSYDEGFLGAMYELQKQGVPLVIPINQEQVVAAIQHETQLSNSLYTALGKDIKDLNKKIAGEISRGISNGATYREIARNIAGYARVPQNNAMRIARTEAHRIQEIAASHAQAKAKSRGADIVKIWDATLDSKTRPHHMQLDGQIRELEEPFEVAGLKAMHPSGFGRPEEDINCRCRSRADARWALSADETKMLGDTSKMSQEQLEVLADKLHLSVDELKQYSGQIIPVRASSYDDFKRQYNQLWRYEGSDLQKEAEKRIGGYANQRVRSNAQKMKAEVTLENDAKSSKMKPTEWNDTDTKAIYDYMSVKSYVVNEKLRNGITLSEEEQEFVDNLDRALDKLPVYEGNLQRSLLFSSDEDVQEFVNRHAIGKTVVYDEYISTTKGATYNPEGQVQIYIQDAKNGKDMSALNDKEQEVLYKKGSSFEVLNVLNQEGTYYILVVEKDE